MPLDAAVFLVTANRLSDGRAVYLAKGGAWVEALTEAETAPSEAALEAALGEARAREREVCDPYVMKAARVGDRIVATSARERIRAAGPAWIRDRFGYAV